MTETHSTHSCPHSLLPPLTPAPTQLCTTDFGKEHKNKMYEAVKEEYHNNWILDNLPASMKIEDATTETVQYFDGFPIGFVEGKEAYIYNHANIAVSYHEVEAEAGKYRIVGFQVEPFSINHEFASKAKGEFHSVSAGR